MKYKQFALAASLFMFGLGSAYAVPSITAVKVSAATVKPKTAVKIVVSGKDLEDAICALQVNYGDGTSAIREMDWSKKVRFPLVLHKTYLKPGKYRVSVQGVRSGMYLECLGKAASRVTVVEPPPSAPAPSTPLKK
jgi:hypothetical protein